MIGLLPGGKPRKPELKTWETPRRYGGLGKDRAGGVRMGAEVERIGGLGRDVFGKDGEDAEGSAQ